MVFPKTLCDDISSSDYGATDKASFSLSFSFLCLANGDNWFGVHSPRGRGSVFLAMGHSFRRTSILAFLDQNVLGVGAFCDLTMSAFASMSKLTPVIIEPGKEKKTSSVKQRNLYPERAPVWLDVMAKFVIAQYYFEYANANGAMKEKKCKYEI
ncbi:hypothetical protein AVEN_149333-1 [Araneus ventricosus]|uniref:Uncharacterized protein n=1 Tax=Araneus ventricosus TaxID=182803 RepID=A0A4Y2M4U7_ARAVE|nr:hypothetical protein AVEN_149333-1 [Araneus ventricosus]